MAKFNFRFSDLRANNRNRPRSVVASDYLTGKTIYVFPSIREAARKLEIKSPSIVACLKGRIKTAGGYFWSYLDGGTE